MARADAGVRVIAIHAGAPPKPAVGAPCNGCGVCCLSEPCPVGVVLSRRRTGACAALRWSDSEQCYRCGALSAPREVLPYWLNPAAPLFARLARRWIAAGTGCDSLVEVAAGAADPGAIAASADRKSGSGATGSSSPFSCS
jgi:hypothetical protein